MHFHEALHPGLVFIEHLIVSFGYGAGNNQRRTGIVDQYGIDLVDNCKIVLTLYQILRIDSHIITQIIETEFVVRTESNIGHISLPTLGRIGLMLIDTIDRKPMEHIKRSHPLRVTFSQVIVYRHHMHTTSAQSIQKHRKSSHQGLSFTGSHLCNFSLMQNSTTDQLHVIMHHIPGHFISSGKPGIEINGFVTFYLDKIVGNCQIPVELGRRHFNFSILFKTTGGFLHHSKGFRHQSGQNFFHLFVDLFFQLIYTIVNFLPFFDRRPFLFHFPFECCNLILFFSDIFTYFLFHIFSNCT